MIYFFKILKTVSNNDVLTLFIRKTGVNELGIRIENKEKNTVTESYLKMLDISEEKQRLQQHLNYFTETLSQEASGKKLGFIAQEMGREINTLGSKCNHSEIQRRVVIMKDHLEKIKEQVLNAL